MVFGFWWLLAFGFWWLLASGGFWLSVASGFQWLSAFGGLHRDRAAVDRAVDLALTLLSGAQGPGPGTQLAPRDPGAPP